ncbi:uncharacterized protein LOC134725207 [Mytilus trossulus]|uniref:uncharacterized protein LOC134725207 n=1 Tax=Mytilus trossulus TaxID=6551 RepID=UPI003003EF86
MAEACGQNGKNKQISKSVSSSSSDGSLSIESSTISMPPAPDGGYGWIIVFSAFLTNMICDGIAFSFGVMYSELLDVFDASKSTTSWVASLFFGMPLIAGPLAGGLATKFGCRKVLIFGGILTSVGIFASAFADSIGMLCFSFGIVAGTGMSMGYVTSLVMVAFYFHKKRAFATGLAVCGSGIGTFLFAPFLEYLIEEYTWRGSFIILSGITLNLVVCGALLRPLEFTPEQEWQRNLEAFEKMSRSVSKASLPDHGRRSRKVSESDSSSSDSDEENYIGCEQLSHSQVILPTFLAEKKNKIPKEVFEEMCSNTDEALDILKNYFRTRGSSDVNIITNPIEEMLTVTSNDKIVIVKEDPSKRQKFRNKQKAVQRAKLSQYFPMCRKDLFYRGNIMKISHLRYRSTSCPELYHGSFDDDSSDDEDEWCPGIPKLLRFSKHLKKFLRTMFDPKIIKSPLFILFALSNFILYFWYDVPYVFSVDQAKKVGISDKEASYLLSVIGGVNTIGQIMYGYIGDKNINLPLLYGLSISLSGLALMFYPMFTSFSVLAVISGVFGFFISANYVLSTLILVEFLGMDKLTNAYGLTMLIQGIANMIGPPVAGLLYDTSGSYNNTFYFSSMFIILAGFMLTTVPVTKFLKRHLVSHGMSPDKRRRGSPEDIADHDMTRVQFLPKNIEISV